jgi:hypothetical protein
MGAGVRRWPLDNRAMPRPDRPAADASRTTAGPPFVFSAAALAEARAKPDERQQLGAAAQQLASDVVAEYEEIVRERVVDDARESAEKAARQLELHEAESELSLDRAKLGLDLVRHELIEDLDRVLEDLWPELCDAETSLSREEVARLLGAAERAVDGAAMDLIEERMERLAPGLPQSDLEPGVARERATRARLNVEKAEQAAADAESSAAAVQEVGRIARGRLVAYRVGDGLGPAAYERIAAELVGDLRAAEARAESCRASSEAALLAYMTALEEIDGKGRPERAGEVTVGNELEVGVDDAGLEADDDEEAGGS